MESVGTFIQLVSFLFAFLAAAILLWINRDISHSKKMLVFLLLILSLLNLNGVLFHTGWYIKYPAFHKIAIPFSLLLIPAGYLYIRSVLLGELKFRKTDWLLFLPTLLFAVNLFPYYIMPVEEKRAYLIEYYKKSSLRTSDSEGILPAYVFAFFRSIWSLFFIILNYRLIHQFKKRADKQLLADNAILLKWVTQLNGLLAVLLAAAMFAAVIAPIKKNIFNILDLALGAFVLIICLKLFLKPQILYGLYKPSYLSANGLQSYAEPKLPLLPDVVIDQEVAGGNQPPVDLSINSGDALRYKAVIENYFTQHQPFLKADYSLEQLVKDVHIPRYILSAFINREYGIGFREFLNRYRVEYMIANLNTPAWKSFTLEAIAMDCGFSSRSSFIKNFKDITGQTPSEFIKGGSPAPVFNKASEKSVNLPNS